MIGFDRDERILNGFRAAGFAVERDWFKLRSDDPIAYWELVRARAGIGFNQAVLGQRDPEFVEIPFDFGLPRLPIWLTAHEAVVRVPRVRRVWELLSEGLARLVE